MMKLKKYIRNDFKYPQDKNRDFNTIRKLFNLTVQQEYTIDDTTWNDLEMNELFSEIDRTYSCVGQSVLYSILRNPLMDKKKLSEREKTIDVFSNDLDLTTNIRYILFKLGNDSKNILLEMLNGLLTVNKKKYYLYTLLGIILPVILVVCAIVFDETKVMVAFMILACVNIGINKTEETTIRGSGLVYLRDVISAAKKLSRLKNKEINLYTSNIKEIIDDIKIIDRATFVIEVITAFGGILGLLSVPFLIEERTYYKISGDIEKNKEKIYKLLYLIGELDALIGIASYKVSNREKLCIPQFTEDKKLNIIAGTSPLLEKPVGNNISIDRKGIVLTGTNMSGKSTFLRMLGTNIILVQTFNFAFAKEYEGCLFNVVSSISLKDDIKCGKSYYLAEAESLLRVIKAADNDIPVFTLIDEIFRGTNPVERIASSAEILSYINKRNAIVIVATHDRELTNMLREEYEFYYFSEEVDKINGLKFDYKIKKGISENRNAIRLLEYIGYPKRIVEKSYVRCREIENYM